VSGTSGRETSWNDPVTQDVGLKKLADVLALYILKCMDERLLGVDRPPEGSGHPDLLTSVVVQYMREIKEATGKRSGQCLVAAT
jgi:hypothetical protein